MIEYIPNVIRSEELANIPVDSGVLAEVKALITPDEVFAMKDFDKPEVITPMKYPDFNFLVKDRDKIRRLQLLPVKTDEEYIRYHQQPKELLFRKVLDNLGSSPMALAINAYPYFLPEDLGQYIIWVRDRDVSREEVYQFIARYMQYLKLLPDELILFERPLGVAEKIVRGSYADMRHIHFWFKIET